MQNSNLKMQNYKSPQKPDPPSEEKFKINKFKHLSLRGAERRRNPLANFVIASSPEASGGRSNPFVVEKLL